jgi:hypothetical protein
VVVATAAVVKSCMRFAFVSIAGTALGVCECQPEQLSVLFGGVGLGQKKNIKANTTSKKTQHQRQDSYNDKTATKTRQHQIEINIKSKSTSNRNQHQLKINIKSKSTSKTKTSDYKQKTKRKNETKKFVWGWEDGHRRKRR